MKKVNYIFIMVFVFFFGIQVLEAETVIGTRNDRQMDIVSSSSGGIGYWTHSITTKDGIDRFAICLDPGVPNGVKTVVVKREMLTGKNKRDLAYDAGLVQILNDDANDDKDKLSKIIAARIYNIYFGKVRSIKTSEGWSKTLYAYKDLLPYYNSWGNSWGKLIKDATGSSFKREETGYNATYTLNGSNVTKEIMNNAKKLTKSALIRAKEVRNSKGIANVDIGKGAIHTTKKDGKTIKYSTRTVKFRNFNSNSSASIIVSCPECKKAGITMTYSVDDSKTVFDESSVMKLSQDKFKNGARDVSLKVMFTANSTNVCSSIDYAINVEAKDDSISTEAYIVKPNRSADVSQEYTLIVAKNKARQFVSNVKINYCATDCNELKDLCEVDHNPTACDKFYKDFGGKCAECATKIKNVECSAEEQTINIKEGIEVDQSCNPINTALIPNVKDCIVKKSDISGNSYQAKTDGYPNNAYCSVYCTENYDVKVPGAKTVNSGRFLKLNTSIIGAKSCYTNEINSKQFELDLEASRKAIIDSYNEWNKWYTGSISKSVISSVAHASACCNGGDYSYTNYDKNWEYNSYTYYGNGPTLSNNVSSHGAANCSCHMSTCVTKPDKNGKTQIVPCCGSGSCSPISGSPANIEAIISSNLAAAKSNLDAAIKKYNDILKEYNSCSASISQQAGTLPAQSNIWNMRYNYNPKISFWYEDSYMKIAKTNKLVTNGAVAKGNLEILTCSGEVDSSYQTCSTGWIANSSGVNQGQSLVCYKKGSTYECNPNYVINVANAKYVKQTQAVTANYELPTQFYTVYPSGKLITENKKGTSPLEKAIPISLKTHAGVYNYTLSVEDLGEYYDTGKLGRIWGPDTNTTTSTVKTTLKDESPCKTNGALKGETSTGNTGNSSYVCSYKVNCPECIVECGPNGCIWKECEDNSCKIICKNCLFTNGKSNFSYRTVSIKDINPNDRELGANWKTEENNIKTTTELKAAKTTNDIIAKGEKIYDEKSEDKVLSVKLTQAMINDIKSYNKKNENNGGYSSDSLKCYDFKDEDGKTYKNVYCYSNFLDEMVNNYKENMIFNKNRIIASSDADNDTIRSKVTNQCEGNNCYWTTWTEALNDKNSLKISTVYELSAYKNNYDTLGAGPSYR